VAAERLRSQLRCSLLQTLAHYASALETAIELAVRWYIFVHAYESLKEEASLSFARGSKLSEHTTGF
jgi:hypothetical protein